MNKFTYNQEQASQIGAGQYVTKSGGYDFKIVRAQFVVSQSNRSEALELDLETREGLKCNYISINHIKGDGNPNEYGGKLIQAIMGCTGVNSLTSANQGNCPELFNKALKGVVQRVDYTKQSGVNAGQDGYKFDFKLPANLQTGKTVKESVSGSEASSFKQYAESITDKDERQSKPINQGHSANPQDPAIDFDDDIPF
jgi:hypothetical protein